MMKSQIGIEKLVLIVGENQWQKDSRSAIANGDGGDTPHDISDVIWDSDLPFKESFALFKELYEVMPCYGNLMYLTHGISDRNIEFFEEQVLPWVVEILETQKPYLVQPLHYWLWCHIFETDFVDIAWPFIINNLSKPSLLALLPSTGPVAWSEKAPIFEELAQEGKNQGAIILALEGATFDVYGSVDSAQALAILENLGVVENLEFKHLVEQLQSLNA